MKVREAVRTGAYLLVWVVLLLADMSRVAPGVPRLAAGVIATAGAGWLIVRRRTHPMWLGWYSIAWSVLAPTCALGLFAYARRHRDRMLLILVAAAAVVRLLAAWSGGDGLQSAGLAIVETVIVVVVPTLLGAFLGQRDELADSLRQRARAAEADRESRAQQAVLQERARIAAEMHDSVGHKLSLISLQAGGLEVSDNPDPARVQTQAAQIRTTAGDALGELRELVGVLASGEPPLSPERGFAEIAALVADSVRAGARIEFVDHVGEARPAPAVGRAAYRIVQEALTNAHRHARGAAVTVSVSGGPETGLEIRVRNVASLHEPTPGAGTGLAALRERVRLLGGTFDAAATADGFQVTVHLPWQVTP